MNQVVPWIFILVVIACAPAANETEQAAAPEVPAMPVAVADSYPDPGAEVVQEVQDFVSAWVAEQIGGAAMEEKERRRERK